MSELKDFTTYKIGQAADMVGVKPFVLRFWEGEFDALDPIRTASGQRLYTQEHVDLLKRIRHLLHEEGLTIEGARKRLEESGRRDFLVEVEKELRGLLELLQTQRGAV